MGGLVGQALGRYEIVALVGKGGMGEVYRARDTELGRDVAVKVLPAETAQDEGRLERFKREARAVAQLSHPNILDIHDFGTENGVSYSVTELLEGNDLRERLIGHPLPVSRVFKIGRVVAEGLAAAHSKGIVHRDIKPANIFVTKTGQVKILDFGIARLRSDFAKGEIETGSPTKTLTEAGQIIGTTAYMSPEQVVGQPADARSDIFSLGCVLYEMITGQKAFDGKTPNETMVAVVSKDPVPIAELRPDAPTALDLLIKRCLEKEPDERFESARDVAFALEALSDDRVPSQSVPSIRTPRLMQHLRAGMIGAAVVVVALVGWNLLENRMPSAAALPETKHLAVMDFTTGEDDQVLTDLADGLTETVSGSLRLLERQTHGAVWVVPRRFREFEEPWTVESVARRHGISLAIEGRLRFSEGRLRLELDLRVPGAVGPIRTAVIEDQIDNVVTFQSGPLEQLTTMLDLELSPETRSELERLSTTVVPALTSYLSGVGRLVRAEDKEGTDAAFGFLEEAVGLDPTFVPARAALLRSCAALIGLTDAAEGAVECATWLPPTRRHWSAEVWAAEADIHRAEGDDRSAIESLQRAVNLNPRDAELQLRLGQDLQSVGDIDGAENAYNRAVDLRPDFWEGYYYLGFLDYVRGNYEATANSWRIAARFAPERTILFSNLGAVFHYLDRPEEAALMLERAISLSDTGDSVALSNLGTLYFESARYAEAVATFQRAVLVDDADYRIWGYLGWSYAAGVDPTRAAAPFERAVELAEEELINTPDDPDLLAVLAGYHGMLGNQERGVELIERAIVLAPQDPDEMATIGETLEDLGDRDRALEWIGRALRQGGRRSRIESHPSLRDLVADERYQQLVDDLNTIESDDSS